MQKTPQQLAMEKGISVQEAKRQLGKRRRAAAVSVEKAKASTRIGEDAHVLESA